MVGRCEETSWESDEVSSNMLASNPCWKGIEAEPSDPDHERASRGKYSCGVWSAGGLSERSDAEEEGEDWRLIIAGRRLLLRGRGLLIIS